MGTLIGHVAPGFGFVLIGLWHLWNTIRNYLGSPWEFHTRTWFPIDSRNRFIKHTELILIMFGSLLHIASELFIFPEKHQPFGENWSIPSVHLNNFEHSSMSLFFFIYSVFALSAEKRLPNGMLHLLAAFAFSQELLLFHFHSADHMGLEGQYHWLLQLAVCVCLVTVLIEIRLQTSFLVALVRSMGILLQGLWFIQMGLVLWIPRFVPIGCEIHNENDHEIVRCEDEHATMRAKALANLQFNWYVAFVVILTLAVFLYMSRKSSDSTSDSISDSDPESQVLVEKGSKHRNLGSHSSIEMEGFPALDLGR